MKRRSQSLFPDRPSTHRALALSLSLTHIERERDMAATPSLFLSLRTHTPKWRSTHTHTYTLCRVLLQRETERERARPARALRLRSVRVQPGKQVLSTGARTFFAMRILPSFFPEILEIDVCCVVQTYLINVYHRDWLFSSSKRFFFWKLMERD